MAEEEKWGYRPKDYEEVYRKYIMGPRSEATRVVRKYLRHATQDELETLPAEIFLRLFQHNMLERFDPTKVPNGSFRGVIWFTGKSVCINHLNKKGRNPLTGLHGGSLTDTAALTEDFKPGNYSLETGFAAETPDPDDEIDRKQMVELLTTECEGLEKNGRNKRERSLLTVLKMFQEERTPQEIADKLGVTTSTIHNYLGALKEMAEKFQTALQPRKKQKRRGPMMPIEE